MTESPARSPDKLEHEPEPDARRPDLLERLVMRDEIAILDEIEEEACHAA